MLSRKLPSVGRVLFVLLALAFVLLLSGSLRPSTFPQPPLVLSAPSLGSSEGDVPQLPIYRAPSHPVHIPPVQSGTSVVWGPAHNMTSSPGTVESPAAMHPSNPELAISGANHTPALILHTTDGGTTWQEQSDPNSSSGGDTGAAWLPGQPLSALFLAVDCCTHQLNLSKSTDGGTNWTAFSNVTTPGFSYDRPYIWTDNDPGSPYYGRLYATTALFGANNYFTVGSQWSSDGGQTWSPFLTWSDPYEYARGENADQYASLAAEQDGILVGAWVSGKCCGDNPQINVPNKIMWIRSTDGGATFPISGTIAIVPTNRSMAINSHSPAGFKWNAAPNIANDPLDGTLYAVWLAYRFADQPDSAAVYIARGTPDGTSWAQPQLVYDNPDATLLQYMPWVQVSPDHAVHVSFGASVASTGTLAQFYAQSTDRGQTFSTPFMLSNNTFPSNSFLGDYQAMSVGGFTGNSYSIFSTWTENDGATDNWGRIGIVALTTATPSVIANATATSSPMASATPNPPSSTATIPTQTSTSTATSIPTSTTSIPTTTTGSPTVTGSNTPAPSPTVCTLVFSDVPSGSTFYVYVRCLACRGIISGYSDGTFRPNNDVTRGQLSKIVSNAAGFQDPVPSGQQTFADVPNANPFWLWIERLTARQIIGGYPCGGPGEPCDAQRRSYFRWGANATRGQISKIVSIAANMNDPIPSDRQTFADVPNTNPFWLWIERLAQYHVMGGYPCGGPGEPCDPLLRPYFRWADNATRGQTAKIVANTFFPQCSP